MRVVALSLTALVVLSACDPGELVDSALKRTAFSVVNPVVNIDMPAEPASQEELKLLARDVGVEAGTATRATIRDIAIRPAAQSCYAANGVPPVR
jgi:hypothetical protein